jgi:hypothetical protein
VQVDLRCTLAAHPTGDHFALVRDLDGPDTGALWTTWTPGHRPADVIVLADCDAAEPGTGEPCCEFTAHPGAHTFDIADPWTTGLPG